MATIIFLVALSVKLAYVHERLQLPDINHPTLDSKFHDEWARGIAFDQWSPEHARVESEPYFRAPLYPYFVAAVYRWVGDSPAVLFTIQAILGALTAALLYLFCYSVFDPRVALLAALLHIAYWPFTYHEAELMLPALSLPLDMLLLFLIAAAGRSGKTMHTAMAGVVGGLAAIVRPSILIVLPFVIIWLIRRQSRRRRRHAVIFASCVVLAILPVTLRNVIVGRDLVPIAWQGGVNFFIGNNSESNGITAVVPGTRADWWGGFADTRRIAEEENGRSLKPSEVSEYWYHEGIEFLLKEPGPALRLYVRKLGLLLGNSEPSNERQLYFRREHSAVLKWLFVNFALVMATAVVGVGSTLRASRDVRAQRLLPLQLAVPYAAGVLAFFITSRFRLPVVMFLIPLSAAGCVATFEWLRLRHWRTASIALIVMGTVFMAATRNPYQVGYLADARGYYSLGLDHFRERDYEAARLALSRSIDADSNFAPSWVSRGRVNQQLGNGDEAIRDLERACHLDPSLSDAFYWLGVSYQKAGQHSRAGSVYLRSISLDSTRVEAFTNLADVYFRERRVEEARQMLSRALEIDSTYAGATYGMGYYHEVTGDLAKAKTLYEKALPFRPAVVALERLQRGREPR